MKDVNTDATNEAAKFITDKGTVSQKDNQTMISLTQTDYTGFAATHGIEKDQIKAFDRMERALVAGAMVAGANALAPKIAETKAAGDDPSDLRAVVKIARPNGGMHITTHAETHPNNLQTGEKMTKFGSVGVRVRTHTLIDTDAAAVAESVIRKAMTGK